MAQLTKVIGTEMRGKETMRPDEAGPSWLEGLAGIAKAGAGIMGTVDDVNDANAKKAAAAADAADKTNRRGALNFVAGELTSLAGVEQAREAAEAPPTPLTKVGDALAAPNADGSPASEDKAPLTKTEVQAVTGAMAEGASVANQASRWQAGVKQGRISAAAYELKVEKIMREAMARFPDQKWVIFEAVAERGLSHPIMSEWRAQQAAEEKEAATAQTRQEKFVGIALEYGYDPDTYDDVALARIGLKISGDNARFKQVVDRWDYDRKVTNATREDHQAAVVGKDEAFGAWMDQAANTPISETLNIFNSFITDNSVPEEQRVKMASEFINVARPRAYEMINDLRQRAVAAGMSTAEADKALERNRRSVDDLFLTLAPGNPVSILTVNTKIRQMMTDKLGIAIQEQMPMLTAFTKAMGTPEAVSALVEQVASDPKYLNQFKREMNGFSGLEQGPATLRIKNVLAMMEGNHPGLARQDPAAASQTINDSAKLLEGVLYGQAHLGSPSAQARVYNVHGQLANAAIELNEGSSTTALVKASLLNANKKYATLLNKTAPENQELRDLVGDASRLAAQHLLVSLKGRTTASAYHTIEWSDADGQFVAKPTGKTVMQGNGAGGLGVIQMSGGKAVVPPESQEIKNMVGALNSNLNLLMATTKMDDDPRIAKATRPELLRYYTSGIAPQSTKPKAGADGKPVDGTQLITKLQKFWADYKPDTSSIPKIDVQERAAARTGISSGGGNDDPYNTVLGHGKYGSPDRPLTELTLAEAIKFGKEVLIPNSKAAGVGRDSRGLIGSSAMGAFQFTQETLKRLAPEVLGENWQNVTFTADVQDRLAERLFNEKKAGNLKATWQGLPDSTPGAYANMSWDEVRKIIAKHEVSASGSQLDRDLEKLREARPDKLYKRY